MLIAHFGDTHIRNLKYHKEYRENFSKIYEKLRELKPDIIVHCGDLAHTKTQISPEFVQMCSDFLRNLADIAPTYVLLGNHDGLVRNSSRLDSISPIVESLDHKDLYLLKDSQEVIVNENFTLNAMSMFDEDNWLQPSELKRVNIAMYHGSIKGCITDTGWAMDFGDNEVDIFENFDYALLGDIHLSNQTLDEEGRVRYCGSTIQQNFAESDDKGFLLWDIKDKENFSVDHHIFPNPKPFVTIELNSKGSVPGDLEVPPNARLRIIATYSVTLEKMRRAIDVCKTRFKPESITFVNKSDAIPTAEEITSTINQEDLRDISVQEEIIREFLKDYQVEEDTFKEINALNKKYNIVAEQSEEVTRNVKWRLKKFKWDNLFNYGQQNEINFSKLRGTVGIFGKNYSGKSSIIDGLLYTIFNTTAKNNRKNLHVVNQNEDYGNGSVEIEVGKKTYVISRESEKYEKKVKGEVTTEAKTDVEFKCKDKKTKEVTSLTGLDRNDTDKNIRRVFGTVEDFLLTSLASQLGSLSFIGEGSTRRKEILAKFLDLDLFEQKFKLAKADAAAIKGALSKLGDNDYSERTSKVREDLAVNEIATDRKREELQSTKDARDLLKKELDDICNKMLSSADEMINIKSVLRNLTEVEENISSYKNQNEELESNIFEGEVRLRDIEKGLEDLEIEVLRKNMEDIKEASNEDADLTKQIELEEQTKETASNKTKLLNEVPCGDSFPKCKFIKDAHGAQEALDESKVKLRDLRMAKDILEKRIADLEPDKIRSYLDKYDDFVEERKVVSDNISAWRLEVEKNKGELLQLMYQFNDLQEKKNRYEDSKDEMKKYERIFERKEDLEEQIRDQERLLENIQEEIRELYKNHGSLEKELESVEEKRERLETLQKEYTAYELYLKSMHSNGISYDIIKKKLPVINEEISKILANIVNFEVFFEEDGKKLDIMIKHPKFEPRPLEMGSGAEKTIASMAIRLALIKISTLPAGDIFVLDEPATSLDADHMEGFIDLLEMIKNEFKTVLLISHLDILKDVVDKQIVIQKDARGYASANF